MVEALVVDDSRCTGCRLCEMICSLFRTNGVRPSDARCRIIRKGDLSIVAVFCRHCDDAPCMDACVVEAIKRDSGTGAVIIDIDELARMWKVVAAGLRLAQKKITVILLAGGVTLEEANEALILGVSGVIIKPFLPEFHLKRVYNIIHRKLLAKGQRVYPRFYAGEVFQGSLTISIETTDKVHTFELVNVTQLGAAIRSKEPEIAPELQPKVVVDQAVLRLDSEEFPVAIEVRFRRQGLLGVKFQLIKERQSNFNRFIQRLSLKDFGISGIEGKKPK